MARYIRLDEQGDYEWLLRSIENLEIRAKMNPSLYCDRWEIIQRVLAAVQGATKDAPAAPQVDVATPEPKVRKRRTKRAEVRVATLTVCSDHPTYGAKRRPRTDCEDCWTAYARYAGKPAAQKARIEFDRKRRNGS
jgi:hypothetical protein